MKFVKWILILLLTSIVIWYSVGFIKYSTYDAKKVILEINENTLILGELKTLPDATYKSQEVKITDTTKITGIGLNSLFIKNLEDLSKNQKVKIWLSDKEEMKVERIVVYNFF